MNIIIKNEYFDSNKIRIKKKINREKLTYILNGITIIGIPIYLENVTVQQSFRNILLINCKASPTKHILYQINEYFKDKYGTDYKSFIKDDIIKVTTFDAFHRNHVYISFKNIILKNSSFVVQIFTI